MKIKIIHTLILLLLSLSVSYAQNTDSVSVTKPDSAATKKAVKKAIYSSARKAAILSAILPGAGQIYNGKRSWWKAPVIYVALGGLGYWGINNHNQYKYYSTNLSAEADGDPETINGTGYSQEQLVIQKNYYKKYRDIALMTSALVYVINIIDANVDAHLKTFDVSDDLSMQIKPYTNISYNSTLQTGLTIKLKFK